MPVVNNVRVPLRPRQTRLRANLWPQSQRFSRSSLHSRFTICRCYAAPEVSSANSTNFEQAGFECRRKLTAGRWRGTRPVQLSLRDEFATGHFARTRSTCLISFYGDIIFHIIAKSVYSVDGFPHPCHILFKHCTITLKLKKVSRRLTKNNLLLFCLLG